jgi:hypothetical protein
MNGFGLAMNTLKTAPLRVSFTAAQSAALQRSARHG